MDKAYLQIGIVAGQYIHKVHLLPADNLRQTLPIFVGEHIQVVMRQFITQNVGAITGT